MQFTSEEGARRYQDVLVPLMFAHSARQLVANVTRSSAEAGDAAPLMNIRATKKSAAALRLGMMCVL